MNPLVSICLPNLNSLPFLGECLEAIIAQTYRDWELIVCDSYSDDGSWELLQQRRGDPRIKLFQVPRAGLYAGWNECLRRAQGEYVYIAPGDDTCQPDLLEKMVGALESQKEEVRGQRSEDGGERAEGGGQETDDGRQKPEDRSHESSFPHPSSLITHHSSITPHHSSLITSSFRPIDIAVCRYRIIDETGKPYQTQPNTWPMRWYGDWMERAHVRDGRTEFLLHACFGILWWTMNAVVFRRSLLDRVGLFRIDRGSEADLEWSMRASLASDIVFIPEYLANWRRHSQQASAVTHKRRYNRTSLTSLEAVCDDPRANIPETWRAITGWRERICRVSRLNYRDSLELTRDNLRRTPTLFFHGLAVALRDEPGFLMQQLARGFAWSKDYSPDPLASAGELIKLFNCIWPPSALEAGRKSNE